MESKIYTIFPTPVMKFKFHRKFNDNELAYVHKSEFKTYNNHSNTTSLEYYALDKPDMKFIKKFCEECLDEYMKQIVNPANNVKYKITQSWLNFSKTGESHHMHSHTNSIISGVFYFQADKSIDSIEFVNTEYKQFQIIPKEVNDYNTLQYNFPVGIYDLILFPSNVHHLVPENTGKDVRISLAFNAFIEGEMGSERSLNYLKL
jgi:hypothetical protein